MEIKIQYTWKFQHFDIVILFSDETTYLNSLTAKLGWPPNIIHLWTCRIQCHFHETFSSILWHAHLLSHLLQMTLCKPPFISQPMKAMVMVIGRHSKHAPRSTPLTCRWDLANVEKAHEDVMTKVKYSMVTWPKCKGEGFLKKVALSHVCT